MKKIFTTALLLILFVFCFTGCGASDSKKEETELVLTQEQEQQWYEAAGKVVLAIHEAVLSGNVQAGEEGDHVFENACASWETALPDIGEFQDIVGKSCHFTDKEGTVTLTVKGSRHDADVVFTMVSTEQSYKVTAITTNVEYSMEEKIQQAGMNTLLGMGTTFAVLILLAIVIGLFGKVAGLASGTARPRKAPRAAPVVETKAAPAPPVEEKTTEDDDAVVTAVIAAAVAAYEDPEIGNDAAVTAVIAAAIAAYEESAAEKPRPDEFVARTIKKSRRKG